MKTLRNLLVVALVVLIASPVLAGEPKKGGKKGEKKAPPCPAAQRAEKMLEGINLTDEQKAKVEAVTKEFGPKLVEAMKTADVLTPEQKKTAAEAAKAAKAAGKKGKELAAAVAEAVKLSDEQKAKQAEARKGVQTLEKQLKEQIASILTEDQKAQLKQKLPAPKKEKKAKKEKK